MKSKAKIGTAVLIAAIAIFILWCSGIFYIVDRQTSPGGRITATVYSRDVSDTFPKNDGFTIKTRGEFHGTSVRSNGSVFENMWWSPDSNYLVIAYAVEEHRFLELDNYKDNSGNNLNVIINMGTSSCDEFTSLMKETADWETLQFDFIRWNDAPGSMTVAFEFTDYTGKLQRGTLDFNFETGMVSNIAFTESI